MLADVLMKAVQEICTCQEDIPSANAPLRHDLNMLVAEMDRIRSLLDTQPKQEASV